MPTLTQTVPYHCHRCGHQWEQKERWDDADNEWVFDGPPYGWCPICNDTEGETTTN